MSRSKPPIFSLEEAKTRFEGKPGSRIAAFEQNQQNRIDPSGSYEGGCLCGSIALSYPVFDGLTAGRRAKSALRTRWPVTTNCELRCLLGSAYLHFTVRGDLL